MDDEKWKKIKAKWANKESNFKPVQATPDKLFTKDLVRGKKGEHDFYQMYSHCIYQTDGRRGDFELNKTGEIIELKSDYYDPRNTPNFFIERYSYADNAGGPWQAKEHNVTYYIYWYPVTGDLYIFNLDQLLKKLRKLVPLLTLHSIKNKNYNTRGYKIERELLNDIMLSPDEIGLHSSKGQK